jgi:hypothetical protein
VALEDFLSLGDDIALHIIKEVIDERLGKDGEPEITYEMDLPLDAVPYMNFYLGDRVTAQSTHSPATTATMRILQFRCEIDDDTGTERWSAQLEPWS